MRHWGRMVNVLFGKNAPKFAENLKSMACSAENLGSIMVDLESFCLEELKPNSFLIIRVDVAGPMEKYKAATEISRGLQLYQRILKEKNITILVMTPKEGLETLTEDDMRQIGWVRSSP